MVSGVYDMEGFFVDLKVFFKIANVCTLAGLKVVDYKFNISYGICNEMISLWWVIN